MEVNREPVHDRGRRASKLKQPGPEAASSRQPAMARFLKKPVRWPWRCRQLWILLKSV
jgi:hypothetical protein